MIIIEIMSVMMVIMMIETTFLFEVNYQEEDAGDEAPHVAVPCSARMCSWDS